jgi:hypothetical protein
MPALKVMATLIAFASRFKGFPALSLLLQLSCAMLSAPSAMRLARCDEIYNHS